MRVGKPLFGEAWRPACRPTVCTLLPAEEASGKQTKMPMLTFTSSLALERENPLRQPKAENRETDCSGFPNSPLSFLLVGFRNRQPEQHNRAVDPHATWQALGACSLVVWQCIAFATSFLLASQTTSVAAAASCMATSYTTTKLSHVGGPKRARPLAVRPLSGDALSCGGVEIGVSQYSSYVGHSGTF